MLIVAAGGGTVAVWQGASRSVEIQAERQSEKAKRDNREARIKRLMATLDDDELDALEQGQLTDEEERLSLEALLRRRSYGQTKTDS
jgi:hypothetical protein